MTEDSVQDIPEGQHRNGCTGCEHPANAFPGCWTDEQVSEEYFRVRQLVTGQDPVGSVAVRDIPEEMVEAGARAVVEIDDVWDEVEDEQRHVVRTAVRAALSAALAGRTVVDLRAPSGRVFDPERDPVVVRPDMLDSMAEAAALVLAGRYEGTDGYELARLRELIREALEPALDEAWACGLVDQRPVPDADALVQAARDVGAYLQAFEERVTAAVAAFEEKAGGGS